MDIDKEIQKQIEKCSRCGLCLNVCPVYKAKLKEAAVTRGKLLQLKGVCSGDIELNKEVLYNIDLCLNCEKCKIQCPSGIDAVKIFSKIKNKNQNLFESFYNKRFAFKLKLLVLKAFYTLKRPFPFKRARQNFLYDKKLVHFKGCVSKNANISFEIPYALSKEDFKCCALPFYVKGKFSEYNHYKDFNIQKINNINGLVVFDCATCLAAVKSYGFDDPKTQEKLVFYTDIYKEFQKKYKLTSKTPLKVTYHHPCHLNNAGISVNDVEEILSNIENVTYIKMENPDECCGFGGDFFTRHPRTADILSTKKAEMIKKTGADIVLSACPTCIWSLKYGKKRLKLKKTKVQDLSQFLYSLDIKGFNGKLTN